MNRARVISLLAALVAAGGWLFYQCAVNQNINFLTPGGGSWIIYPTPPSVPMLNVMPMTTVFRREFVLPKSPAAATVSLRCFKAGQLTLNGKRVAATPPAHWKKTTRLDVAGYLHAGTNELEESVACDNGLPALSLELAADGFTLKSDARWTSSLEHAAWEPAWLASQPVEPAPGNGIYGAEEIGGALRACWPLVSLIALVAALVAATRGRWGRLLSNKGYAAALLLLAMAWGLLFLHNFPLLPAMAGFDAPAHLAYIEYIQQHRSLPSARDGFEFFQAPLYYLLGADLLGLLHLQATQLEAGQVLCLLNLLLGAAELALILSGLRLLFPGRPRLQIAGVLLAAFLPLQVYLLHYPTNETLGAVTTTAAFLVCLKILRRERPPMSWFAGLGLMLGMALLSKASAVVALAAVFLALAARAWLERQAPPAFLRQAGLAAGLCLALGGWHYWKLWRQFGNPLAGSWDPAVGGGWWQLPGYHTASYYLSFGQSLARPFFCGFGSFWDSLYSTFWADGLMGGESILYGRPPWNYNFMTIACVLALVPSALFLTGLWRAVGEGLRQRRTDLLLLAAAPLLYGFAILSMTLKLPYYQHSKALFGLPAVLPFCALSVMGLEFWAARFRRACPFLLFWMGCWLLAVYAAFWVRPDTVQTRLASAMALYKVPGQDPGPALARVLAADPRNPEATVALAALDRDSGHLARAVARLEAAATTHTNAIIDAALARFLGEQGRLAEALDWAARACALTVDYPNAPSILCSLSLQAGRYEQAARAAALALRLKPQDDEIHFDAGLALERLHRHEEAAAQFSDAVNCSPNRADAHFWLGAALWNLPGRKAQGRDQVALAVRLAPKNAQWKTRLDEMQKQLPAR